jgi:hypothetical protein
MDRHGETSIPPYNFVAGGITRGLLEPEPLTWTIFYHVMPIVHFIMDVTKNQLLIMLLQLKFKQILAWNKNFLYLF